MNFIMQPLDDFDTNMDFLGINFKCPKNGTCPNNNVEGCACPKT